MATATPKTSTTKKATSTTAKPATKKVAADSKTASTATAKKTTTTAEPGSTRKSPAKKVTTVSPEHRYHMIATAAYFLAERRGFAGGYEMQDWISAEAEIDAQLKG